MPNTTFLLQLCAKMQKQSWGSHHFWAKTYNKPPPPKISTLCRKKIRATEQQEGGGGGSDHPLPPPPLPLIACPSLQEVLGVQIVT